MAYGELPLIQTADGQSHIPALPIIIDNPPKTAALRLPTSDELIQYLSVQRVLSKDIGRRQFQTDDVPTPAADLKLFTALRLDKSGPEFDDAEISYALGLILRNRVSASSREGSNFIVTLKTLFGEHTHTLRPPTHKELQDYQRHCYVPKSLPHGVEEQRFPPEVPVKLYDALITSVEGYLKEQNVGISKDVERVDKLILSAEDARLSVPPHHKRAVVLEVVSMIASLDPVIDPNS